MLNETDPKPPSKPTAIVQAIAAAFATLVQVQVQFTPAGWQPVVGGQLIA